MIEDEIRIGSVKRCSDIDDYAELLTINGTKISTFMDKYFTYFSPYFALTHPNVLGSQKKWVDVGKVMYVPGEYHRYITIEPFVKDSAQLLNDLCKVKPNAQVIRVVNYRPFERDAVDTKVLEKIESIEGIKSLNEK